jgi:hypothetical protein
LQPTHSVKTCETSLINLPAGQAKHLFWAGSKKKFALHLVQNVAVPEQAAQLLSQVCVHVRD